MTLPAILPSTRSESVLPYAVCALLVTSAVSWRSDSYFSGTFDPVVLVKAVLSIAALALALVAFRRAKTLEPVGTRTICFLTTYLVVTCLGGWSSGTTLPSVVVAVRVAILAGAAILLLQAYDADVVLRAFVRVMGLVGLVAAVTGIASLSSGRLSGGLPPLLPNSVANLCAVPALVIIWRTIEGRSRGRWDLVSLVTLMAIVLLTGSRTSLAALVFAALVMIVQVRKISAPVFIGLVALIPSVAYLASATSFVSDLLNRGGSSNVSTLSSRTIAWNAALNMSGSWWQQWFGGGLAMKHIPVSGQYWQTQILDSSWISVLVQGGMVGVVVAGTWAIVVTGGTMRWVQPSRSLWLGLLAFIIPRSIFESGLFDATPDFMLFLVIALLSEPSRRVYACAPQPTFCAGQLKTVWANVASETAPGPPTCATPRRPLRQESASVGSSDRSRAGTRSIRDTTT